MIKTGIPVTDWGFVKLEGKTYYIQYVLQINRVFQCKKGGDKNAGSY